METFDEFQKNNPVKIKDAANDMFQTTPKSSVKLIKNSKGIFWEIKLVENEEHLLEKLMVEAVKVHKKLEEEFKICVAS
jgi:hypothetical protein